MALFPPNSSIVLRQSPSNGLSYLLYPFASGSRGRHKGNALVIRHQFTNVVISYNQSVDSFGHIVFREYLRLLYSCRLLAHNGTFSEGFQMQTSPQTHASMLFQAHTATGKLQAELIPTIPSG